MADMVQFDLVSPEQRLASVQATEVQIPGADGDLTAMAQHAPTITTLRPGVLRVIHAGGTDEYIVSGGFAEITGTSVSVLAEEALAKADVTPDFIARLVAAAETNLEEAKAAGSNMVDDAAKTLADLGAVAEAAGITT